MRKEFKPHIEKIIRRKYLIRRVNLVQFILDNVNSPMYDQHGRTPIHFAALNGHSEVVKIIIN